MNSGKETVAPAEFGMRSTKCGVRDQSVPVALRPVRYRFASDRPVSLASL
jgi:hypothetical protein